MMTREEAILFNSKNLVEFYKKVEAADAWDSIDVYDYRNSEDGLVEKEYKKFLEVAGLNYDDCDDPDYMWEDFTNVLKEFNLI